MTKKWWKTEVSVLAIAGMLLLCAMPAAGGQIAKYDSGAGSLAPLQAVDDNLLELPAGQSVTVKFEPALTDPSLALSSGRIRVHMVTPGADPDKLSPIWNTTISLATTSSNWYGFMPGGGTPEGNGTIIGLSDWPFSDTWFEFPTQLVFPFFENTIVYVKITAPSNASVFIDAVEAPSVILDPVAMIENLVAKVTSCNLAQGIDNSLDAKLEAARDALNDVKANNNASAVNKLEAFINEVNAQRGGKLTDKQANDLIYGVHNTPPLDPPNGNFSGAQDIINAVLTAS